MIKLAVATSLLLVACGGDSPQQATTPTAPSTANAAPAAAGDGAATPATAEATAAPAAADGDAKYKESAERVASFSKEFATVVVDNKDDCDAMAGALKKLTADNQDFIEEAKALDKDPGFRQYLEQNYKAQLEESMRPMVEPLRQCISNPSVQEAIKSLNG